MRLTFHEMVSAGTYHLTLDITPPLIDPPWPLRAGDTLVDLSRLNSAKPKQPVDFSVVGNFVRGAYHRATLGGNGLDRMNGQGGADFLNGGTGPDVLQGGGGPDICVGGPGIDFGSGCESRTSIP